MHLYRPSCHSLRCGFCKIMISELQKKLRDYLNSESGTTERKPESGQIISHWQSQDPIPSPRAPQIRSDRRIKQKKKSLHKVNDATAVLPAQGLKEETTGVKCINFGGKSHIHLFSWNAKVQRKWHHRANILQKQSERTQNMVSDRTKVRVQRNNEEFLRLT